MLACPEAPSLPAAQIPTRDKEESTACTQEASEVTPKPVSRRNPRGEGGGEEACVQVEPSPESGMIPALPLSWGEGGEQGAEGKKSYQLLSGHSPLPPLPHPIPSLPPRILSFGLQCSELASPSLLVLDTPLSSLPGVSLPPINLPGPQSRGGNLSYHLSS